MQDSMYEKIYALDNLYLASKKALKGKKSTQSASRFWMQEDKEILKIHQLLKDRKYTFGRYRVFNINDKGVLRKISAAPFRDRVVHHAIMNIIEPGFEKSFIYDTYANRKGKGVSKALYRMKSYMKKYKYYLKIDIQKYFPSIDHEILKNLLAKKIYSKSTLNLLYQLIDTSNKQHDAYFYFNGDTLFSPFELKKGIPLGNLTSQFFGNVYLNKFDHYVKEVLRVAYVRYVDDMVLFSNEKLSPVLEKIEKYLTRFRLKVHPQKTVYCSSEKGLEMLGHKIYATHIRLLSKNVSRARVKLTRVKYLYTYEKVSLEEAKNKIFGIIGFMKIGNNYKLIDTLLAQTVLQKPSVEVVPSWGQLQQ